MYLSYLLLLFIFSTILNKSIADTECPYVPITISDRRPNKNNVRLVQYNVEWLFLDYYSQSNCPGSGCTWKNQTEAQTHFNYVTNVIKALNPDIINFCEIEGCDELSMLTNSISKNYIGYLKKGTDSSTGQNVGLLTKIDPSISLYRDESRESYPIEGSQCGYTGTTGTSGVSKHYITEFNNLISNYKIALISAHLLAIPTDPTRCAEREAQSQVLQNIILNYINKGYEVIMLGDFNDFDGDISDINNNKPSSQVLSILKGNKGKSKGKYQLLSVGQKVINQSERYSDWYDSDNNCNTNSIKDYSTIDHILVTPNLYNKISNVFYYHGYNEFCGKYNSDHYPVVIDLLV